MRSIRELASLAGRVALVTGGAGHIGSATCDVLEELGAQIAVADLPEALSRRGMEPSSRRQVFPTDLSDEQQTRTLVQEVLVECGQLDVLVHCAGYVGTTHAPGWNVELAEQTIEAWDKALRVNLTAAFILAQEAREPLSRSGQGSIVFMSSIYGAVSPVPQLYEGTTMHSPAAYGVSKAGIQQLARQLAVYYAPEIRVNVLVPGGVARGQDPRFVERYEERTPLKRMATEEDFKGAVAFLASGLSAYVTGQCLVVDGGWTIW